MRKVFEVGSWTVSMRDDEPSAALLPAARMSLEFPAPRSGGSGGPVRLLVELKRFLGPIVPRALLGGVFTPDDASVLLRVEIVGAGEVGVNSGESCRSELWSEAFVPGLPAEYLSAVSDGVAAGMRSLGRAGEFLIDRAGHDPVNSSETAFRRAAELLTIATQGMAGASVDDDFLRDVVGTWG